MRKKDHEPKKIGAASKLKQPQLTAWLMI